MSKRYWAAIAGGFLGVPIMLFAFAVVIADDSVSHRVWAAVALFLVGWGTHRFETVAEEEYDIRYPTR
jgi:hypothetical protein